MNKRYFDNCKDLAEAKKLWRELCLLHHPDKGGRLEIMQEINKQYAEFCQRPEQNYKKEDFQSDFYDFSTWGGLSPGQVNKIRDWFISNFPKEHPINDYIYIIAGMIPGFEDLFHGYRNKDKQQAEKGGSDLAISIIKKIF